jgi:hypothetical protein
MLAVHINRRGCLSFSAVPERFALPTSQARQKKLSMHEMRDVVSTAPPYEHLGPLNSEALTAESQAERAGRLIVEARLLIDHVRSAIAESRLLRAQRRATTDSTRIVFRAHP